MRAFLFGTVRLTPVIGDIGLLVLRVFTGLSLALAHGWGKLPPGEGFLRTVTNLGFPAEMAWLTSIAEFFGGLALAVGLLTRPAALAIAINFVVVGFVAHANDPYLRKELPFLFLAASFMFLCTGGGRFAVDRLIRR